MKDKELHETLDACRCLVDATKAIKRDYESIRSAIVNKINDAQNDLRKLDKDYENADARIAETQERYRVTLNRIENPGEYRPRPHKHVSRITKCKRQLEKLRVKFNKLREEIGALQDED